MPINQSYQDVHVDTLLSNFSVAFWQDTSVFVGTRFFGTLPVNKASDKYKYYPQGYFNRVVPTRRAEEGVANSVGYKTKERSYATDDDAARIFISDRKRSNVDAGQNLDQEATMIVTDTILLGKEQEFVDKFLMPGQWAQDWQGGAGLPSSGNDKWSTDTSDPIGDILTSQSDFALRSGGRRRNKGLMTLDVLERLLTHPAVLDRILGGSTSDNPARVSVQQLANLMMVDEIQIMQSIVNTAAEGVEDGDGNPVVNNEFFASNKFMLAHVAPTPGLYTATAGLTFVHNEYIPLGVENGPSIRRYRGGEGKKGEYIEAEMSIDQKLVAPDLGELWYDLL